MRRAIALLSLATLSTLTVGCASDDTSGRDRWVDTAPFGRPVVPDV